MYTEAEIIAHCKYARPDLIFIDHVGLMDMDYSILRLEIMRVLQRLRRLAKETNSAIVVVSQMNREMERRQISDMMPRLSDLAESSALEKDASDVFFIHWPYKISYQDTTDVPGVGPLEKDEVILWHAKSRYGETGVFILGYDGEHSEFFQKGDVDSGEEERCDGPVDVPVLPSC